MAAGLSRKANAKRFFRRRSPWGSHASKKCVRPSQMGALPSSPEEAGAPAEPSGMGGGPRRPGTALGELGAEGGGTDCHRTSEATTAPAQGGSSRHGRPCGCQSTGGGTVWAVEASGRGNTAAAAAQTRQSGCGARLAGCGVAEGREVDMGVVSFSGGAGAFVAVVSESSSGKGTADPGTRRAGAGMEGRRRGWGVNTRAIGIGQRFCR
jgi:hypothetical protein